MKKSVFVATLLALSELALGDPWKASSQFTKNIGNQEIFVLLTRKLSSPTAIEGSNEIAQSQYLYLNISCPDLRLPNKDQKFGFLFQRSVSFESPDFMHSIKVEDYPSEDPSSGWYGDVSSASENQMAQVMLEECAKTISKRSDKKATAPVKRNDSAAVIIDNRDKKKYKLVDIAGNTWMAENLNFSAAGSSCYGSVENNCKKYGRLFNLASLNSACPEGMKIPSLADWNGLANAAGGNALRLLSPEMSGPDMLNFNALGGGLGDNEKFMFAGAGAYFWTSSDSARMINFRKADPTIYTLDWLPNSTTLISIRCILDKSHFEGSQLSHKLEQLNHSANDDELLGVEPEGSDSIVDFVLSNHKKR